MFTITGVPLFLCSDEFEIANRKVLRIETLNEIIIC